ncbi:hypothetical protein B7C51_07070 [Paenibacillus larvae subsp. pulvifaciens]|uniref:Uncharacterized protein n=1 Tax=Paenibacillus larvae subsp. pulvifaciens TaxID=1477 RepID=A0A1V0URA7_9BACL|nr:hypothetical protein [Paenibacillus larvae]ARF67647.1 hypothetical protein B7C51_07070 [Paenibacillus larvae subsp. pulvifaciens]
MSKFPILSWYAMDASDTSKIKRFEMFPNDQTAVTVFTQQSGILGNPWASLLLIPGNMADLLRLGKVRITWLIIRHCFEKKGTAALADNLLK